MDSTFDRGVPTVKFKKDGALDKDRAVKVLGIKWNVKDDTLVFAKQEVTITKEHDITKNKSTETIFKNTAVYDHVGHISPMTVRAKTFIQELWRGKIDWDQKLAQELPEKWLEIANAQKG